MLKCTLQFDDVITSKHRPRPVVFPFNTQSVAALAFVKCCRGAFPSTKAIDPNGAASDSEESDGWVPPGCEKEAAHVSDIYLKIINIFTFLHSLLPGVTYGYKPSGSVNDVSLSSNVESVRPRNSIGTTMCIPVVTFLGVFFLVSADSH